MAVSNQTILGKIYLNGTNDYQQRVPNPTQATIADTFKFLSQPMNGRYFNEFIDAYINLVGMQVVHSKRWDNPLAVFMKDRMLYGSTVQESAFHYVRAHSYDDEDTTLLKMNRPEAEAWYHTMNYQNRYDISVNRPELLNAVHDEYGLNKIADAILTVPFNSDAYDTFTTMVQLIAEYEQRWGFYKEQMAVPVDDATGKAFLTSLRTYADLLRFPSAQYNAGAVDVPVFANPSELVLIIEAGASASVDVNTLASIFNLDLADIKYRKVVVPEIPVDGAFALLTTDDFFQVYDKVYETDSFYNPQTLTTNYYLHHWATMSVSPFVPSILFTTEAGTAVPTVTMTPTTLALASDSTTVERGGTAVITPTLSGTVDPANDNVEVAPDAVTWSVEAFVAATQGSESVPLNSRTRVDRLGVLHVQRSGLEDGNVIVVHGASTYYNPDGTTPDIAPAQIVLTVQGDAPREQSFDKQQANEIAKEPYTR